MLDRAQEAALISAAQRGDSGSLTALLAEHRDRIWGICYRTTGNRADAEDAAQECMIAIWRGIHQFRGASRFSTWVYRVAANASLAAIRRRREFTSLEGDIDAVTGSFEEAVATRDLVQQALAALPDVFRVALVLREFGDLSYEEIAAHEGIPVQTVKSRIHRARSAVRDALAVKD
ncbi:MAG: RNA polymerase sigma factor [Actinomycetota bacterium]